MFSKFHVDPHPRQPKILFVGWPESSHTHAWIDLLDGTEFNVRLFGLPHSIPPATWRKKTYVTVHVPGRLDGSVRERAFPPRLPRRWIYEWRIALGPARGWKMPASMCIEHALAHVLRRWQPDIIHTLGLEPAAYIVQRTRQAYSLPRQCCWVAQARGGPELALHQYLPEELAKIQGVLADCDQFIADNPKNYDYAVAHGLAEAKKSPLGVVPGTGGIDVDAHAAARAVPPSHRERVIVWPKTYEAPSSKALPAFEAIRLAWERIKPCRIEMLWVVQTEIRMWMARLPQEIQDSCRLHPRVPREEAIEHLSRARVMFAPSLTDGVPNSMLEAMALGAFPLVSPLETIAPVAREPENVLFARNLYPHEMAEALVRAMNDDALVDAAAANNLTLVRRIADRAAIRPRVIEFYRNLAATFRR